MSENQENPLLTKIKTFFANLQFKFSLKENHWSTVVLHGGIMVLISIFSIYAFFYIYLPSVTLKGEIIHVPDLEGKHISDLDAFFKDRDLRYLVNDTIYDPNYEPLTVIKQNPKKGDGVKVDRKIYLTINALDPPKRTFPYLRGDSEKSVRQTLLNQKFKIGEVTYVSGANKNSVLGFLVDGEKLSIDKIKEGTVKLPQGTVIDLEVVGNGVYESFQVPNLLGMELPDVEIFLAGQGLIVGEIIYVKATEGQKARTVVKQRPAPSQEDKISEGEVIDIWVVESSPE
jgi:beta-lactam-binding protein with PASTA domain